MKQATTATYMYYKLPRDKYNVLTSWQYRISSQRSPIVGIQPRSKLDPFYINMGLLYNWWKIHFFDTTWCLQRGFMQDIHVLSYFDTYIKSSILNLKIFYRTCTMRLSFTIDINTALSSSQIYMYCLYKQQTKLYSKRMSRNTDDKVVPEPEILKQDPYLQFESLSVQCCLFMLWAIIREPLGQYDESKILQLHLSYQVIMQSQTLGMWN